MKILVCVVTAALWATTAQAVPILSGDTTGPDSSFSINFSYSNDSTAGETIVSMFMDGSTAFAFPIMWDSIGILGGQTAVVGGVDTQLVTFDFTSSWDPSEIFTLSAVDPDGDPGPAGVSIGELAGVQVGAVFSSGATALYQFVDDPAPDAGVTLARIPEPISLLLFGIGLVGIRLTAAKKAA